MWRGDRIESTHAVAACACSADGEVQYASGTIDVPLFLRSTAKPFIAAAVVRSGAVERFGFEPAEIALMAASHNGEDGHVAGVASILAKIGAGEGDLQCGVQTPRPTVLHHNCSGKHAGILALARMLDAPLATYLDVEHPAEQAILAFCERMFGERLTGDRIAVDGCGIPVVAVSLRRAATAFARLATLTELEPVDREAVGVVRDAMRAHPWYVAGTGRFDTDLMAAGPFVAKSGAEGVQGIASARGGLGIVLKVVDGARRAADPASVAVLDALGLIDDDARVALADHATTPVTNVAGRIVGSVTGRSQAATPVGIAESKLS